VQTVSSGIQARGSDRRHRPDGNHTAEGWSSAASGTDNSAVQACIDAGVNLPHCEYAVSNAGAEVDRCLQCVPIGRIGEYGRWSDRASLDQYQLENRNTLRKLLVRQSDLKSAGSLKSEAVVEHGSVDWDDLRRRRQQIGERGNLISAGIRNLHADQPRAG